MTLGRAIMHRWKYYFKMDSKRMCYETLDRILLAQRNVQMWEIVNTALNLRGCIKREEFIDYLRDS